MRLPAAAPLVWRDVLTGETVEARLSGDGPMLRVARLLGRFPVALVVPEGSGEPTLTRSGSPIVTRRVVRR